MREFIPWLTAAVMLAALGYLLWTALSNSGHHQIRDKRLYWLGIVGMTISFLIFVLPRLHL